MTKQPPKRTVQISLEAHAHLKDCYFEFRLPRTWILEEGISLFAEKMRADKAYAEAISTEYENSLIPRSEKIKKSHNKDQN